MHNQQAIAKELWMANALLFGFCIGAVAAFAAAGGLWMDGHGLSNRTLTIVVTFLVTGIVAGSLAWALAMRLSSQGAWRCFAMFTITVLLLIGFGAVFFYLVHLWGHPEPVAPLTSKLGLHQRFFGFVGSTYFFRLFGLNLLWPWGYLMMLALCWLIPRWVERHRR